MYTYYCVCLSLSSTAGASVSSRPQPAGSTNGLSDFLEPTELLDAQNAMAPMGEAATAWAQAMEHFVP